MCEQMKGQCVSCACPSEIPEPPLPQSVYREVSEYGAVRPGHYMAEIEAIDFIEANNLNFNLGNVIKYATRCHRKGDPIVDLQKAMYYIRREIAAISEAEARIGCDNAR